MSIGCVIYNNELVRVWMITPTINYTTYVIRTNERMRNTVANGYVMKFRSIGNCDFHELNVDCPAKEPDLINISRTMAHYYINRCNIEARLQHVSIGGSILRVHQIRDFKRSPKINDICMNMAILRSLTRKKHSAMNIETGSRCVRIKYYTNRSLGTGSSLVIGENGVRVIMRMKTILRCMFLVAKETKIKDGE